MRIRPTTVLLGMVVLASSDLGASADAPLQAADAFAFRQGQSVYVTAFHTIEHSAASRSTAIASGTLIDNHLPAEFRIRKDFEKRQIYRLVNKASDADFVFVVLIDDSAAEGLAMASRVFADYQNPLNMAALREAAYARSIIGPLKIHNLGRLSEHLVRRFHEMEGRTTP